MTDADPLLPDRFDGLKRGLADRYSIEGEVGVGAMGVVYYAQDIRHERRVALKVLRPEIAASVGSDRFLHEVRIEAQLNHPHILPVYDSGEVEGLLYCVMPFVEGESLRERLNRERQLPCSDALRICREIADALFFAHARDIIHRDVKPANILLEAGHAVLADFGLAKALTAAGDQGLTRAGFAVGTPAYTSPEQAAGEAVVDGRTDLYSLGCVLYEMLVGQPPFVGPTADSVVRQHMTQAPASVRVMRPAVSGAVEEILERLLAKAPADRFGSAEELVRALDAAMSGEWLRAKRPVGYRLRVAGKRFWPAAALVVVTAVGVVWATASGRSDGGPDAELLDRRAIAVLYFEDLSPGRDLQYAADGLTEGLISSLTRVNGLEVVSGNAVAPYRGGQTPITEIASDLQTGTLIRGSLEPDGEALRVTVRLIEGISGVDLVRRQFEVPAREFLQAQDSLVSEVSWLLRERLGEEVRLRRRRGETSSVEAWALVQRGEQARKEGEQFLQAGDAEGVFGALDRADSLFALAEELDPRWAEPPTLRGWVAYRESRLASDLESALDGIERGLVHAEDALALDPNAAKALELRGTVRYWHTFLGVITDPEEAAALFQAARADLEAAVDADPSLASAYSTLSHLYYRTGDLTESSLAAQRAYEADAYLDMANEILWRLFTTSFDDGRLNQARTWCQEGRRRFPEYFRFSECKLLELTIPSVPPDVDAAWRYARETVDAAPEASKPVEERKALIRVAEVLARAELPDSAEAVLAQARAGGEAEQNPDLVFTEARTQTVLGNYDRAVDLLRQLLTGYSFENEEQAEDWASHWYWRELRGLPEFERLVSVRR